METIARFQVPEDAHLFRCFLETKGVEGHVFDENLVQVAWHYSDAIGGVRVVVAEEDWEAAMEARGEYGEVMRNEPRTRTVARQWPLVLFLSWAFGVPMLIFGRRVVGK